MKTTNLILCLLMIPMVIPAQEFGKDAVVAPVKMNVLYRGLANPVEIAVPGITSDKVTASVTNGTIIKVSNEEVSSGNKITDKMRSLIADCKAGQNIIFKDIKATGPDGRTRDLNPVVLTLK